MNEIKGLTSLRGIAALAVVMQHFSSTAQQHASVTIPSLVPHGYVAVDFFFVLSGYIMCYTYLRAFERDGRQALGPFLKKRVIRLLPLNVFVTFALLGLGLLSVALLGRNMFFGDIRVPFDVLTNLFMLQGLGIGKNLNGPSWSVSAEFIAYLLFPLLIAGAFSRRQAVWVACAVLALWGLLSVALVNPRLGLGSEDPVFGGLRCLSEFTLGMFSYRVAQTAAGARWLSQDRWAALAIAACLLLMLVRIDLLVALTFPFVVATVGQNRARVGAWLAQPWLYFLGNISYSLYLIHNAFRAPELELLKALHPLPLGGPAALVFAFLASLSVIPFAWLTYRWVEQPSREFLRRRASVHAAA